MAFFVVFRTIPTNGNDTRIFFVLLQYNTLIFNVLQQQKNTNNFDLLRNVSKLFVSLCCG